MKNSFTLSTLIFFAIAFSSCQKEITLDDGTTGSGTGSGTGSSSGYYIKFKKDGTQKTFTAYPMAKITDFSSAGFVSLALTASATAGTTFEGINIGINFFNGTTPQTGTYSEDDPTLDNVVAGVYNPNSTTIVYAAGIQTPSVKPLVIKILSKTATEMTGTFDGAFYKQDVSTGTFYTEYYLLTEGEFKLKIQ